MKKYTYTIYPSPLDTSDMTPEHRQLHDRYEMALLHSIGRVSRDTINRMHEELEIHGRFDFTITDDGLIELIDTDKMTR